MSSARSSVFLTDMVASMSGPLTIDIGNLSSPIMFFMRISAGSMSSSAATMSTMRSRIQVSFAHGPR